MKETGVLFRQELIPRLMDSSKTRTMRVIKPQPDTSLWKPSALKIEKEWRRMPCLGPGHHIEADMWGLFNKHDKATAVPYTGRKSPYGGPGDYIYLKEAWADCDYLDFTNPANITPTHKNLRWFKAGLHECSRPDSIRGKWRSPLFMPKWAARSFFEIVEVLVEKVQDLVPIDIEAEGIDISINGVCIGNHFRCDCYKLFSDLWDSINAKPKPAKKNPYTGGKEDCFVSYPWADVREVEKYRGKVHYVVGNPYCFAYNFKGVE